MFTLSLFRLWSYRSQTHSYPPVECSSAHASGKKVETARNKQCGTLAASRTMAVVFHSIDSRTKVGDHLFPQLIAPRLGTHQCACHEPISAYGRIVGSIVATVPVLTIGTTLLDGSPTFENAPVINTSSPGPILPSTITSFVKNIFSGMGCVFVGLNLPRNDSYIDFLALRRMKPPL